MQHLTFSFPVMYAICSPPCHVCVAACSQTEAGNPTGSRLVVRCQGDKGQQKPMSQQNRDRLIIVGTSKLHFPLFASLCYMLGCENIFKGYLSVILAAEESLHSPRLS